MEDDILKLKRQGKASLVGQAFDILKANQPALEINADDYDITVWANSKEVIVKFRRLIRYVRDSGNWYYDITVNLTTQKVSPWDDILFKDNFFIPTKAEQQVIDHLKEVTLLPYPHMESSISEGDENYYINCTSKTSFRHYFINKATGEESGILEGSYAVLPADMLPSSGDDDELEEIKD